MSPVGTKVTNDPEGINNPIVESTGLVTSDSLAAESLDQSGSFASNNPHAAASSQPSQGTTSNNTDTAGATTLSPAPDAQSRDEGSGSKRDVLDAGIGQGKDAGRGPTYATPSDERRAAVRSGESTDEKGVYSTSTGSGANVATAPSYVHAGTMPGVDATPHGKNLKEGGFDDDAPNASFNQEIGSDKDPGRLAEKKFEGYGAQGAGHAGGVTSQKDTSGDGQFDVLKEEQA